jgi:hypothetical protein
MSDIVPMIGIEPVLFGVLKITWQDGYQAVVDLRPVIAEGEAFAFLRAEPKRFDAVKLAEFGHAIYWLDNDADEIDFGSDSLRRRAERQAEILRPAS